MIDTDKLSISFSGEASEEFAERINYMKDWYVRITPQEGEPFDAVLLGGYGSTDQGVYYDAVRYLEASDTSLALNVQPKTVRVRDVYVY